MNVKLKMVSLQEQGNPDIIQISTLSAFCFKGDAIVSLTKTKSDQRFSTFSCVRVCLSACAGVRNESSPTVLSLNPRNTSWLSSGWKRSEVRESAVG